jgi:hypothetical protein
MNFATLLKLKASSIPEGKYYRVSRTKVNSGRLYLSIFRFEHGLESSHTIT